MFCVCRRLLQVCDRQPSSALAASSVRLRNDRGSPTDMWLGIATGEILDFFLSLSFLRLVLVSFL